MESPQAPVETTSVRLAGSAVATPLLKRLARMFVARESGPAVVIEAPLGSQGALRALQAGVLDAALVTFPEGASPPPGSLRVASTPVIVAAGPGVPVRRISVEALADMIRGQAEPWSNGRPRTVLMRPPGDPSQSVVAAQLPRLGRAIDHALAHRRWPVVHQDAVLRDVLRRTSGTVAITDLGSLRLLAVPLWTVGVSGLGDSSGGGLGRLVLWVVPRPGAPARLKEFLDYLTGPDGQTQIQDLGYLPGRVHL